MSEWIDITPMGAVAPIYIEAWTGRTAEDWTWWDQITWWPL